MTPNCNAILQSQRMESLHRISKLSQQTMRTNTATTIKRSIKDANHLMAVAKGTYPPRVEPNGKRRDKNLLSEPNAKRNATKQIPPRHESDEAELLMILQMMTFIVTTLPII